VFLRLGTFSCVVPHFVDVPLGLSPHFRYIVQKMSARSGSQGGLRRSVSLTRISRPSIGVGQHGAQRVSGAAFDSKASGGNSMMLLPFFHAYILHCLLDCKCHAVTRLW